MRQWLAVLCLAACDAPATSDADVVLTCPASCDDGDLCTDDRCDGGACVHVPRDVVEACRDDRHCDDGDPCTTDTCAFDVAGGCPELQRCRHDALPSCRSCPRADGECNDFDACTTDVCGADQLCRYTTFEGCNRRCDAARASAPYAAREGEATVEARVARRDGAACVDGCACSNNVVLVGYDTSELPIVGCDFSCDGPCPTFDEGRYYLVYGQAARLPQPRFVPPFDAGNNEPDIIVPPALAKQIVVEGWCLSFTAQGLNGSYDATLLRDGAAAAVTFQVTLDEMRPTFSGSDATEDLGFNVGSEDSVSLSLRFGFEGQQVVARLFADHDTLAGPVMIEQRADGSFDGSIIGRLTLVLAR